MRDDKNARRAERAMLMPSSAPRPALRRPAQSAAGEQGLRYGTTRNEREYATLRQQLSALEHDIAAARSRLRQGTQLHVSAARPAVRPSPHGEPVTLPDAGRI